MTSAVQVLVIEKELAGCDLKMAAAPKSIILISAEIVLFFPSEIKRQNGFENLHPSSFIQPSSGFTLWPKEHFIIQSPFHPFSVCWPSAATNCEGAQAFFHSATSGPSIYAQVQEQLCTNRQLKTLCHLLL